MTVSRETKGLAIGIDAQLEERASGKRKYIRHLGQLCCRCHRAPPSTNGKYCKPCRNAYDAVRRLAAKNLGETNLSKGKGNDQFRSKDGQMPATKPGS